MTYLRSLPWRLAVGGGFAVLFGYGVASAGGSQQEALWMGVFMLSMSLWPKPRRRSSHRDPMQDDPGGDDGGSDDGGGD